MGSVELAVTRAHTWRARVGVECRGSRQPFTCAVCEIYAKVQVQDGPWQSGARATSSAQLAEGLARAPVDRDRQIWPKMLDLAWQSLYYGMFNLFTVVERTFSAYVVAAAPNSAQQDERSRRRLTRAGSELESAAAFDCSVIEAMRTMTRQGCRGICTRGRLRAAGRGRLHVQPPFRPPRTGRALCDRHAATRARYSVRMRHCR